MKNKLHISTLLIAMAFLSACTSNQGLSSYEDDIYYSPKDGKAAETVAQVSPAPAPIVAEDYVDIDERDYGYETPVPAPKAQEEYYDPNYKEQMQQDQKATTINNYYGNQYADDDYYYSNRNRRFNSGYSGFGYYSPYYSYGNWYSYDPFMPRPNYWQPYYNPGMTMGWSSYYGWSYSYSSWGPGWGMNYGNGNPFGFNPYNYGGFNSYYYCPQAYNGFGNGDYYNRRPVYSGQFSPYGSSVASNTTDINRGFRSASDKDLNGDLRPSIAPNLYNGTRPLEQNVNGNTRPQTGTPTESRPQQDMARPVDTRPNTATEREETPSYVRPEADQARPVDTRPMETRPAQDPKEENRPPLYTRPKEPRTAPAPSEDSSPKIELRNPRKSDVSSPRPSNSIRTNPPSNNSRGSGSNSAGRRPR
jgi:hypothetical protein